MTIDIGSTLRLVREAKGLKLKDVAVSANISSPFLTMVEQGQRQPSVDVLGKLAIALKIPRDALMLASQPASSSLRSRDDGARRILLSIAKLQKVQDELRRQLEAFDERPPNAMRDLAE